VLVVLAVDVRLPVLAAASSALPLGLQPRLAKLFCSPNMPAVVRQQYKDLVNAHILHGVAGNSLACS
jgi:hypothetical protein